jgi:2-polyprenyl-6-methoxyphenol hydroxylase-like FAD-dependent oxidoreductase
VIHIAALKALRVIPDDDEMENTPSVEEMPEDEMTPEQLREALRFARRVRAILLTPANLLIYPQREAEASQRVKQESVKHEHVDFVDDDDEVTVVESRSSKRPRGEPEVIVLD